MLYFLLQVSFLVDEGVSPVLLQLLSCALCGSKVMAASSSGGSSGAGASQSSQSKSSSKKSKKEDKEKDKEGDQQNLPHHCTIIIENQYLPNAVKCSITQNMQIFGDLVEFLYINTHAVTLKIRPNMHRSLSLYCNRLKAAQIHFRLRVKCCLQEVFCGYTVCQREGTGIHLDRTPGVPTRKCQIQYSIIL